MVSDNEEPLGLGHQPSSRAREGASGFAELRSEVGHWRPRLAVVVTDYQAVARPTAALATCTQRRGLKISGEDHHRGRE